MNFISYDHDFGLSDAFLRKYLTEDVLKTCIITLCGIYDVNKMSFKISFLDEPDSREKILKEIFDLLLDPAWNENYNDAMNKFVRYAQKQSSDKLEVDFCVVRNFLFGLRSLK